jgi:hypothetical protein
LCYPTNHEELKLPFHFQELLKPAGWGCWEADASILQIHIGDLFDSEGGTYIVEVVYKDRIEANIVGTKAPIHSFVDPDKVSRAIARKQE